MAPETIEETALIKVEELNAIELFTEGGIDNILTQITEKAEQHVPDAETDSGRAAIKSLAYRVARTKTILDDVGKDLVSSWKAKAKKVDNERKKARDTLDSLKEQVRKPLTEWEAAEQAKEDALHLQAEIEIAEEDAYKHEDFLRRERELAEKEAEMARKEEEQRQRDREEIIAKSAAEKATREAEAEFKEGLREAAEKAEKDKQERRAANKRHRTKVDREAVESFMLLDMAEISAKRLVREISEGNVTNVTLNY